MYLAVTYELWMMSEPNGGAKRPKRVAPVIGDRPALCDESERHDGDPATSGIWNAHSGPHSARLGGKTRSRYLNYTTRLKRNRLSSERNTKFQIPA